MSSALLRLFFALWPDSRTQSQLAEWGRTLALSLGGRLTRAETVHLTLAFIGDTPAARLDELLQIGAELNVPRFDLRFDMLGCFERNGVAWAAPNMTPKPLLDLVAGLHAGLRRAGFPTESRPYQPHVTLLRKARCRPIEWQPRRPLLWKARNIVLVRSDLSSSGADYFTVGKWPLS